MHVAPLVYMKLSFVVIGSTLTAFGLLIACSGANSDPGQEPSGSSSGGGQTYGDVKQGDSGTRSCEGNSGDLSGCACSGPPRACWTVPSEQRNENGCKDGKQTCSGSSEFATWSSCTGEVKCGGSSSGGSSSGGIDAAAPPTTCECFAGAVRWCDTPVGCDWGQQTCMPDGNWGKCNETALRPTGCNNPNDSTYDQNCCLQSGSCCQDYEGPDENKSKGKCEMIACPSGMAE
jgi:hypothetical protein